MLGSAERRKVRLIIRELIFEEFQRSHVIIIHQRHRRTDGRTNRQLIMAIPRYATLRAVMICVTELN